MRRLMPPRSAWRVMQFDTLRLRLVKLAARVVELKKQATIHLPSSAPDQAIFAMLLTVYPAWSPDRRGLAARRTRYPSTASAYPDPDNHSAPGVAAHATTTNARTP